MAPAPSPSPSPSPSATTPTTTATTKMRSSSRASLLNFRTAAVSWLLFAAAVTFHNARHVATKYRARREEMSLLAAKKHTTRKAAERAAAAVALRQRQQQQRDYASSSLQQQKRQRSPDSAPPPPMTLAPVRLIERYKEWHGVGALEGEQRTDDENPRGSGDAHGRKYAIAFYNCPFGAGNRIHEFLNELIFSMLTNRTLLYKYYDSDACRRFGDRGMAKGVWQGKMKSCKAQNSIEDCSRMIRIQSDWVPSYDEWSTRLGIDSEKPYYVDEKFRRVPDGAPSDELIGLDDKKVVVFSPRTQSLNYSDERSVMLLPNEYARRAAGELYSLGVPFAYGMAFHHLFEFSDKVMEAVVANKDGGGGGGGKNINSNGDNKLTIAVHSRHTADNDDGCNVTRELDCIEQLLQKAHTSLATTRPCTVYAMADRECTLSQLRERLRGRCDVDHVANHEEEKDSRQEHGPFSGIGYFQDLAFVSANARDALVVGEIPGDRIRTSSAFMREMVEYNRRMELWQRRQPQPSGGNGDDRRHEDPSAIPDATMCKYVELHSFQRGNSKTYEARQRKKKMAAEAAAAAEARAQ